ncbi:MAG TPA: hypothetical protein PK573_06740 [Spirochaetota bacterium]|nr:hypothetical protein [Spirochaetota bacterium]HRZ26675.1 hypothetical protein [Spirochaetota bacterium]HSA13951.1 hypothetical protein [Spirochaetota bacterium]
MVHLISDKLVELVEKHSRVIIKRWVARLITDPTTSSFSKRNINSIEKKAMNLLEHMGKWVSYDTTKEEVGKRYAAEGIELFKMEIPLCEVIRAMYTLRRILWLFIENESAFDTAFQLHQMKELSDRIILFFDRAEYYTIRGYMEEMNRKIKEEWKLDSEETNKIFFYASFYNK